MAWNEPGKPGQDPWGQSGKPSDTQKDKQSSENRGSNNRGSGPNGGGSNDELDALIKKVQGMFSGQDGSNGQGFNLGSIVLIAVAFVAWLLSGIYIVDSPERGVVTRFGAFVEETKAGPHWHLPYPIESVQVVNVDQIRTAEIGYRSDSRNRNGDVPSESLMLSKDENIIDVKIAVQYKIVDASKYLFEVADPDATLRTSTESALREVVGQNKMDFVLTEGRNEVVSRVKALAQAKLDDYHTGLLITSVNLQDAQPPEQVQSAFADVVKAREDRERLINEAQAYANDILPKARGQAARQLEEASAYHDEVIARATGQSSRFTSIVTEYQQAPKVTRERMYMDAITQVFGNSSKILISAENSNHMMYLPLDKMMSNSTQVPFTQQALPPEQVTQTNTKQPAQSNTGERTNIREFLRNRELR